MSRRSRRARRPPLWHRDWQPYPLALRPDHLGDGAAGGVAADVLHARELRHDEIDDAAVAQGELDRAGLDLRRLTHRLHRIGREHAARHVGERKAGLRSGEIAEIDGRRRERECARRFRPAAPEIEVDRELVDARHDQRPLCRIGRIGRRHHLHDQTGLARDRPDQFTQFRLTCRW